MDGAGHCEARARKGRGAQLLCGERTGDPARSECRGDGRGTAPPERWVLARGRVPAPPHVCRAEGAWQGFLASSWDRVTLLSPLKVVQSGGKNIELAIMRRDQPLKVMAAPAAASAGIRVGGGSARSGWAPRRPASMVTALPHPLGALKRCPQLWGRVYLLVISCQGAPLLRGSSHGLEADLELSLIDIKS